MTSNGRPVLVYDGDCGFCTRCVELIARYIPTRAELVPYQSTVDATARIDRKRAENEVLWIDPDGRVDGGARAVTRLLIDAGGPWAVIGAVMRVPPLRWLAHAGYVLVARNRHRLPGTTPACQRPPEQWPIPSSPPR